VVDLTRRWSRPDPAFRGLDRASVDFNLQRTDRELVVEGPGLISYFLGGLDHGFDDVFHRLRGYCDMASVLKAHDVLVSQPTVHLQTDLA
jgi:hypothetical protein